MISDKRGFSLLEVLIALCVLSVGVLGLVKLQSEINKRAEHARRTTEALYLAETRLEALRGQPLSGEQAFMLGGSASGLNRSTIKFIDITNESESAPPGFSGFRLTRMVTGIPAAPAEPYAKHIVITVSWQDRNGAQQSVALQTVVSAYSELD